jgi:hypothetical protein
MPCTNDGLVYGRLSTVAQIDVKEWLMVVKPVRCVRREIFFGRNFNAGKEDTRLLVREFLCLTYYMGNVCKWKLLAHERQYNLVNNFDTELHGLS